MSIDGGSSSGPAVPSRATGILLATSCAAASGAAVAFGKVVLEDVEPLAFCFWLFLFSLPPSVLLASLVGGFSDPRRISRAGRGLVLLHSVLIFAALWTFWTGLRSLDPTVTVFLARAEVIVAVGLGVLIFRERFGVFAALGAVATLAGVVVMGIPTGETGERMFEALSPGLFYVLGSSVLLGLAEVVAKGAVRHVAPAPMTFFRNVLLALAFGATTLASGQAAPPSPRLLALSAAAALLGPTLARFLFLLALRRLALSWVTLVTQSTPLFTAAAAVLLIGQLPTTVQWVGGAIVIAGSILVVRDRRGERDVDPA